MASSYWHGKHVDEMTREELLATVRELIKRHEEDLPALDVASCLETLCVALKGYTRTVKD